MAVADLRARGSHRLGHTQDGGGRRKEWRPSLTALTLPSPLSLLLHRSRWVCKNREKIDSGWEG